MKLIRRGKLFGHDWYVRIGKRITVTGVNSLVGEDTSVLFWEFDGVPLTPVINALTDIQETWSLSKIYLLQSHPPESWHAVCMARFTWLKALGIVATTRYVDADYVRLAAHRGHFTLRLTDKGQGIPKLAQVLPSDAPESASVEDFVSGVRYGAWMREDG